MAGKLKARFFPSLVLMYREVSARLESSFASRGAYL